MMLNNKNASNGNLGDQQIPPPVMNSVCLFAGGVALRSDTQWFDVSTLTGLLMDITRK